MKMKIPNVPKWALIFTLSAGMIANGCKKYDDDISRLEKAIGDLDGDLSGQLSDLKTQLQALSAKYTIENIVVDEDGALTITYKSADGQTQTQTIKNGEDGEDGDTFEWRQGEDGFWEYRLNAGEWVPTANKWQGEDGQDGKPGSVVEIKTVNGESHFFIDGEDTGVQVPSETMSVVDNVTSGRYELTFNKEDGSGTETIFLYKSANTITSLSLMPSYHVDNLPVILFPRIVVDHTTDRTTLHPGYAVLSYKLNPFGVAPDKYDVLGFVTNQAEEAPVFRAGATAQDVSNSFLKPVVQPSTDFGQLDLHASANIATGADPSIFPGSSSGSNLYIGLVLHNKEGKAAADEHESYVVSSYHLAKEEIVDKAEVTIEKVTAIEDAEVDAIELAQGVVDVTGLPFPEYAGNEQNSIFDASSTEARDPNRKAHFELHYAHHSKLNGQPYDLSKELRGFFLRDMGAASELVSMDDNGLGGYELHYSIPASFSPTGDNQNHQVYIEKVNSNPLDGNIHVTTITTVPDGEKANTAAIGKTPIVRVDLRTPGSNTNIATRYFKIHIGQDAVAPITVAGTLNLQVTASGDDGLVAFNDPSSLDHAYNRLGLSSADFHLKYTWDPASVAVKLGGAVYDETKFTVTPVTDPTVQNRFEVAIDPSVMPGTYTITGQYKTGISADQVVDVVITVTVGDTYIGKLSPKVAYWNSATNPTNGVINGRLVGTDWLLHADLWDYWDVTPSSGTDAPVVTYEFGITNPTTTNAGISVLDGAAANAQVQLNEASVNARSKVNTGTQVLLTVTRRVNGVIYNQTDIPAFNVIFNNPVKAIVAKAAYRELTDKEVTTDNTSRIDLRRLFSVADFNNTVLYDFNGAGASTNVMDWARTEDYGIVGYQSDYSIDATTVEAVGAYNGKISDIAGQTAITLGTGANFSVVGNDAVWTNNGANLLQPITLVYKVKLHNRWNVAEVTSTEAEVEQLIYIFVNPTNN